MWHLPQRVLPGPRDCALSCARNSGQPGLYIPSTFSSGPIDRITRRPSILQAQSGDDMGTEEKAVQTLIAKDAIRELALLYSRSIDRKDVALLRTLYTRDATDTHGDSYEGPAEGYYAFIERSLPHLRYSGHHICNHLISVDGDEGEGEVCAICYH